MKNVCFVTSSRADYGLLSLLIQLVKKDKILNLQVIVTGSHLSKKHGYTIDSIKKDKIHINSCIKINTRSDNPIDIINITSSTLLKISNAYNKLRPDIVILLGDRYEIFSAAIGAKFMRIPIVHFHGGEVTEGAIDESIRHSISKMSSLHFVSNLLHKKRLIQLGENKKNIFNIGALGIDVIKKTKILTKVKLGKELGFNLNKKLVLVTFHPVTLENNTSEFQFNEILKALESLIDTKIIFTLPNADMYGNIIIKLIEKFCHGQNNRYFFASLGNQKFYSLLKYSDLFIGNSSSGIIEAPYFKNAIINIGDRQKGRLKSKSIIDCKPIANEIKKAIKLSKSRKYKSLQKMAKNPYEGDHTSKEALVIIKRNINKLSIKKKFYDINF